MYSTTSLFKCSNCHTSKTKTKLQSGNIFGTDLHVNGRKDVKFNPGTFLTKAQLTNNGNAPGWARNGNYKAADSYDSTNLNASTWTSGSKTCYTSCHVNQSNITWGAKLHCVSCHANQ
jgi:hypothetical protein